MDIENRLGDWFGIHPSVAGCPTYPPFLPLGRPAYAGRQVSEGQRVMAGPVTICILRLCLLNNWAYHYLNKHHYPPRLHHIFLRLSFVEAPLPGGDSLVAGFPNLWRLCLRGLCPSPCKPIWPCSYSESLAFDLRWKLLHIHNIEEFDYPINCLCYFVLLQATLRCRWRFSVSDVV